MKYFERFYKLLILAVVLSVTVSSLGFAQESEEAEKNPGIEFMIEEKFKITPEEAIEYQKTGKIGSFKKFEKKESKSKVLGNRETSVSEDELPESEIHAAINPTDSNNIIISPIRMNQNAMYGGDISEMMLCPVYYTTDFGETWAKSEFKNKLKREDLMPAGGGDPILVFDNEGTAYMSWIYMSMKMSGMMPDSTYNSMHWAYSENGGGDWQREDDEYIAYTQAKFQQNQTYGLTNFYDKQWMAVDRSNSEYRNTVYLSLTSMSETGGYEMQVYRKSPDSSVFTDEPAIANKNDYAVAQFTQIDVDLDGDVHVVFWGTVDNEQNSLYHTVSTDGGRTFAPETKICDFYFAGGKMIPGDQYEEFKGLNPDRLYPCPQMKIDKSNGNHSGNIYVTFTAVGLEGNDENGLDIYFTSSTDGGETWNSPYVVNNDMKEKRNCQFYSTVDVNPNGVVVLAWYDRRNDVADAETDYYMAYSFNGGEYFRENFKVTTQPTDFNTVGEMNSDFGIGEYNALLTTKGYAIPVWADGRSGDGDLNVYAAFVPIEENPSGVDRISQLDGRIRLSEITPNPANDLVNLSVYLERASDVTVNLYNINGEIVKELNKNLAFGSNEVKLNVSDLPGGEYFVLVDSYLGYAVKKLIVSR